MGMIFVNRDRESLGQFTEQEISNALNSGKLLPDDLAWQEGMESWQPLSSFENLPHPGAAPVEIGVPERFKNLEPNRMKPGKIRFDECLTKGWECFAKNWGVCVVSTLVFFVLSLIVQLPMQFAQALLERYTGPKISGEPMLVVGLGVAFFFFWAVGSAVSAILSAGFMYFYITALRTKANIDQMFAGFRASNWIQILLAGVVWFAAIFVLALVVLAPGIYLTITTKSEIPAIVSVVILLLPIIYISVGVGFVFPLIVDRGIGFWEAITTALKTVHGNWFSAFGLLILVGLVAMSGVILCCVGILATAPLAYMIWGQGYRQLFGDPDSVRVD
ncbi:MAG: DUF4339 domain-containing protein [Verrucomicrobiaceae bacterium]|nr:MAG: DUF4339 domain-containing protein [Verrucomicrobiaceae bacterium]